LGWWSGFWWIDISTNTAFSAVFVTALGAANSFLKNFGFRAFGLSGFLICYLSALAWDGERQQCGYFA
jgi:hypothetical protein